MGTRQHAVRRRNFYVALACVIVAAILASAYVATEVEPVTGVEALNESAAKKAASVAESRLQDESSRVAVFIGDSLVAGAGASQAASRWTRIVANSEGWYEVNLGIGATGYVATKADRGVFKDRITRTAQANPAVVVIGGGRNDLALWRTDARSTERAIFATIDKLHTDVPTAQIVGIGVIWDATAAPPQAKSMSDAVKKAVLGVGGKYLDIGQPLLGHPELIAPDGIHPNDQGQQLIANAVEAQLLAGQSTTTK